MNFTPWVLGTLIWLLLAGGVCLLKKNNGLIDIFWGLGFIILALSSFFSYSSHSLEATIVTALVLLWGVRLSFYLFFRNWNKPEDFRYAAWREEWGQQWVLFSIFKIYLLQAIIMQVIAIPIFIVNVAMKGDPALENQSLSTWGGVGAFIALFGITLELVSDLQKSKFKREPGNLKKICKDGLWKFSRHPNYLGEILTWIGIGMVPLRFKMGLFALISPAFISVLLYFVSGVPLLEKRLEGNPDFEEYKKNTGAIFPKLY